jgi:hypothetical protein
MRSSGMKTVVLGCIALGMAAVAAQARTAGNDPAARREEARARVAASLQEKLVREVPEEVIRNQAAHVVRGLTDEQVDAVLRGDEVEEIQPVRAAVTTDAGTPQNVTAQAVGDATSDLLFVPLPPCRIIDTRLGGGKIAANATRDFVVAGTTGFSAQGGNASGCGVPEGATSPLAAAVMVNIVAVDPDGKGNMAAWEYGQSAPLASSINYAAIGMNIANGLIVPIAGVGTQPFDLSVKASFAGVHLVADVTGYFTRFPVENFQGGLKSSLITRDFTTLTNMSDGACKDLNFCTVTADVAGTVVVEAWGQFVVDHVAGTLDRVVIGVETTPTVSCGYDSNSVDASDYEVSASLGSNPDVDFTLSHGRAFTQPGGTTRTYRLSGQMLSGASTGDAIENSRLICTFIPD